MITRKHSGPDTEFDMRILHTSDWHLGITFGGTSLVDHQQQFFDWLLDLIPRARIDLVVIAGDIFDRAVAPNDAVILFKQVLKRLQSLKVRTAAITGNHDGSDRVANYGDLLDLSGVIIRGGYARIGEVIRMDFDDGPLDLVMLPFLDPQAAPVEFSDFDQAADNTPVSADANFEKFMRRTHESVLRSAIAAAVPHVRSARTLAVSHAFVAGGATSDSERKLHVGGAGTVNAALFSPFSYTALGHLHRPQSVGPGVGSITDKAANRSAASVLCYSGTPLAYSFSENHRKSVAIIDLAPDGTCRIEAVEVPVGRAVLTVTGTIDELLGAKPAHDRRESFVRAIITDRAVVLDAKKRLTAVYPHVIEIELRPEGAADGISITTGETRSLSALESARTFWCAVVGSEPTAEEQAVLTDAIAHAEREFA